MIKFKIDVYIFILGQEFMTAVVQYKYPCPHRRQSILINIFFVDNRQSMLLRYVYDHSAIRPSTVIRYLS